MGCFSSTDRGYLRAVLPALRQSQPSKAALSRSRTGDPNTGEFGEAVILATCGEVDDGMLGE